MKKTGNLLLIIFVLALIAIPAFAAVQLEVGYPSVGDGTGPGGGGIAGWVLYIFYFALIITSIAAVGSLIYAGIVWMTSGATEKISDAKSRIWAAILGIIIVASSVLLLRTINPKLIELTNPTIRDVFNEAGYYGQMCGVGQIFNEITRTCNDIVAGNLCIGNENCTSDEFCSTSEPRRCFSKLDNDQQCTRNSVCLSGRCWLGICTEALITEPTYQWSSSCSLLLGSGWRRTRNNSLCTDNIGPPPGGATYNCCVLNSP